MRQVDARLALIRHAVAAEYEPPRVSPLRRRVSRAMKLPEVSAEVREQYEYEATEREGILMDSGLPEWCGSKVYHGGECCARHVALGDLGCVHFYDYVSSLPFEVCVAVPELAGVREREAAA